ncbi:hypothetical protein [Eikenella corrodens]|uniref:hypothetical protein n=1 Tax=Eikenella corrodens TaxID=539 RepID=UPI0013DF12FD|nr:hypothetical protein [Eikenella corrodens]
MIASNNNKQRLPENAVGSFQVAFKYAVHTRLSTEAGSGSGEAGESVCILEWKE